MRGLRASSFVLSTALHGALLLAFADFSGGRSLEQGDGDDLLRIEKGIAIEGLTRLGDAQETVEAREVIDTTPSVAQPELQEVKAAEVKPEEPPPEDVPPADKPPEIKDVLSSPLGPTQEIETMRPREQVEKPQPQQVATEQQVEQVAVLEQKAASSDQQGGDATAFRQFLGALSRHFEKFKLTQTVKRGQKLESGRVDMLVELDKKGGLVQVQVRSSSGSERLDKLAVESVQRGQPYPIDVQFFSAETLTVEIPFIYSVRQ